MHHSRNSLITRTVRSGLTVACISVAALSWSTRATAEPPGAWTPIYNDNFNYSADSSKFNTWFWREDSAATHRFEDTDSEGCTAVAPCVKLTAQAYPANDKYTNSEMYNNSCVQEPWESLLHLNPWNSALLARIKTACEMPYPYQSKISYVTPFNQTSAWMTGGLVNLQANPLAFTADDVEAPWKFVRDTAFNNPYSLNGGPLRLTTEIRAETKDQGGSRGWGFWNTTMNMAMNTTMTMQFAWFMEYSAPQALPPGSKPTVLMQSVGWDTSRSAFVACSTPLPAGTDIYQWNTYAIEWSRDRIAYSVNGKQVAQHQISFGQSMAFHNWVDNRDYTIDALTYPNFPLTKDKSNLIRRFEVEVHGGVHNPEPKRATGVDPQCQPVTDKAITDLRSLLESLYRAH